MARKVSCNRLFGLDLLVFLRKKRTWHLHQNVIEPMKHDLLIAFFVYLCGFYIWLFPRFWRDSAGSKLHRGVPPERVKNLLAIGMAVTVTLKSGQSLLVNVFGKDAIGFFGADGAHFAYNDVTEMRCQLPFLERVISASLSAVLPPLFFLMIPMIWGVAVCKKLLRR